MNDLDAVIRKAKLAYSAQKASAKQRGIDWRFTFQEWVEWWGEDFHQRGCGRNCLQMQRINDAGPYAPDNVRKGTPAQNSRTYSNVRANRQTAEGGRRYQQMLDQAEAAPCHDYVDEDDAELQKMFGIKTLSSWHVSFSRS